MNPYNRLLKEARDWVFKAKNRHTVVMWLYPKDKLGEGWNLTDLAERTQAAAQLGYDVQVLWIDNGGLQVRYVKRMPDAPAWY